VRRAVGRAGGRTDPPGLLATTQSLLSGAPLRDALDDLHAGKARARPPRCAGGLCALSAPARCWTQRGSLCAVRSSSLLDAAVATAQAPQLSAPAPSATAGGPRLERHDVDVHAPRVLPQPGKGKAAWIRRRTRRPPLPAAALDRSCIGSSISCAAASARARAQRLREKKWRAWRAAQEARREAHRPAWLPSLNGPHPPLRGLAPISGGLLACGRACAAYLWLLCALICDSDWAQTRPSGCTDCPLWTTRGSRSRACRDATPKRPSATRSPLSSSYKGTEKDCLHRTECRIS